MAHIPLTVQSVPIAGLTRVHQGKVRDTYALPDHPDLMLVYASDRISVFDFVLPALVVQKGETLTALNVWWCDEVLRDVFPHDLVAFGPKIDVYLPETTRDNAKLWRRAVVVRKLEMLPIEAIVRGYLTGSGLASYQKTGMVCGHILPNGLTDGSQLPRPIFTPSTKALVGHDEWPRPRTFCSRTPSSSSVATQRVGLSGPTNVSPSTQVGTGIGTTGCGRERKTAHPRHSTSSSCAKK